MTKAKTKTPDATAELSKSVEAMKVDIAAMTKAAADTAQAVNTLAELVGKVVPSTDARLHTVQTNRYIEAPEQDLGATGEARFRETKTGQQILDTPHQDVDDPVFKERMDRIAFDRGMCEVMIHASSDTQMPEIFEVSVNGLSFIFRHGQKFRCQRMFVEGLARSKPTNFGNVSKINQATMEQEYVYPTSKNCKYPFALINPTPQESDWIQSILREP